MEEGNLPINSHILSKDCVPGFCKSTKIGTGNRKTNKSPCPKNKTKQTNKTEALSSNREEHTEIGNYKIMQQVKYYA